MSDRTRESVDRKDANYTASDFESYFKSNVKPQAQAETKPAEAPQTEAATKRLDGRVEFTPDMEKRDADIVKDIFPQPTDSPLQSGIKQATYPLKMMFNGVESVPEDIGNFVAGAAQQNVPPAQRQTVGDMLRRIPNPVPGPNFGKPVDSGYITPSELNRAPQFQAAMQQHPVMNALQQPLNMAGGFVAPVGAATSALARVPLAVKNAVGMLPAMAKLGNATRQYAPVVQNVPQVLAKLKNNAMLNAFQKNPVLTGAATGAAYAPVFAGGNQFGQTRQLQTPSEAGQTAVGGGIMGGALGAAVPAIQNMLLKARIQQLAKQSPVQNYPAPAQKQMKQALPNAKLLQAKMNNAMDKSLANYPSPVGADQQAAQQFGRRYFPALQRKFGPESDEHLQAIAQAQARFTSQLKARETAAERRGYSQQQGAAKQEQKQAAQEQNRAENVQHTEDSSAHFEDKLHEIQSAESTHELEAMKSTIFTPPPGPKGGPLYHSGQRQELEKQWRRNYYRLYEAENPRRPGELEVPPTGQPAEPQPESPSSSPSESPTQGPTQGNPLEDKSTSSSNETSEPAASRESKTTQNPETKPVESTENPVRNFLAGAFRIYVDPRKYGPREKRYKWAVSVDKLAEAAGLSRDKTTALSKWVADLSKMRRELTYKDKQIQQLAEWALKHQDEWIGEQNVVKVTRTTDKKTQNHEVLVLDNTKREQNFKRILLRAKMESSWEDAVDNNLEHETVNTARYGGNGKVLKTTPKPTVRTTTSGTTQDGNYQTNKDGTLEVKGLKPLDLSKFSPPKSADELFRRMEFLLDWQKHFREEMVDIRNATGDYNYLGDGTRPVDVMREVFDKLKLPFINGKAPLTHVWHVDDTGHVSTVAFQQEKTAATFEAAMQEVNEKLAKFDQEVKKITDKDGKIDYDALWGTDKNMSKLMAYFPGLSELSVLGMIFGRQIGKRAQQFGRATGIDALFAGTIDDIMRNHPQFDGDSLSQAFHEMTGRISANFFYDTAGEWHPVKSAEDLAELLNEFKGAEIGRSHFRKRAIENLEEQLKGVPMTHEDVTAAYKKADTALMIRQNYKRLAEQVKERIEEMEIRKRDAATGVPSKEGRKFYVGADLDDYGRVRKSAYSETYHTALNELLLGLELKPSAKGNLGGWFDSLAARKSQSIMANNPRVALKNFFDQAPVSIAFFGKHFFTAGADLIGDAELRQTVGRLPVVPQASMNSVRLHEQVNDPRAGDNLVEKGKKGFDKLNLFLSEKLDPLFKGRAPLVSMADRYYAKVSALASFYKQAEARGMDRHEFMDALMNKGFSPDEESKIFAQTSKDLTRTLNSVAPGLNKDLFASSSLGKGTNQYSTPGRRTMRLMTDWLTSGIDSAEGRADKMRFITAMSGLVALGGSGAIPASVQLLYQMAGAATGHKEDAERGIQWFDQWNVLRQLTGIDYSTSFGPDFFTGAAPALEGIEKAPEAAMKSMRDSHSAGEAEIKLGAGILLEGLSLLPKIGPAGFDNWMSLQKDMEAGSQGMRKIYFNGLGGLQSVTVPYDYNDAMRDWLIGGQNPAAHDQIQQKKLDLSRKYDALYRGNKSIIPDGNSNSSTTSNTKSIFPERKTNG